MKCTIVGFTIAVKSGWKTVILLAELKGNISLFLLFMLIYNLFRNTPYLGLITIIMNDYPQVKFLILAILGTFVLINRDQ